VRDFVSDVTDPGLSWHWRAWEHLLVVDGTADGLPEWFGGVVRATVWRGECSWLWHLVVWVPKVPKKPTKHWTRDELWELVLVAGPEGEGHARTQYGACLAADRALDAWLARHLTPGPGPGTKAPC
jgi:hypothetical protein